MNIEEIAVKFEWTPEQLNDLGIDGVEGRRLLCKLHNQTIRAAIEKALQEKEIKIVGGISDDILLKW